MTQKKHRYDSPKAENQAVKRIWAEVQEKTGLRVPDIEVRMSPDAYFAGIPFDLYVNAKIKRLVYSLGITDLFTDDQLSGALAHELGHLDPSQLKHPRPSLTKEQFADAWAAKHGYGPQLLDSMRVIAETVAASKGELKDDDPLHPKLEDRLAAIRRVMTESSTHPSKQEAIAA